MPFYLWVLVLLSGLAVAPAVTSQTVYRLVADGEELAWPAPSTWTADSLVVATQSALRWLGEDGYALARIDSVTTRTQASGASEVTLFATRGVRIPVVSIAFEGLEVLAEATALSLFDTRPGAPLSAQQLRADLDRLVARYASDGYGLVRVSLESLDLVFDATGNPSGITVRIRVEEGDEVVLAGIEVGARTRTRSTYVARLLGMKMQQPLRVFDPADVRVKLERTHLFARVGLPQVLLDRKGGATLVLDVDEAPPGAFDLVLGLQPPVGGRDRASFVGTGHLLLQNMFGMGQVYELQLNRLPGQVSRLFARASVPLVLGLPLRIDARFEGTQQDSTYGAQEYRASAAIGEAGREVLGTISREAVKPGVGGARVQNGRQGVARSSATFVGIGFHLSRLDIPFNPQRGYVFETLLERGTRERTRTVVEENGELVRQRTSARQERLTVQARLYRPLVRRVVVALGGEGYALRSDEYEEGELFRLGGAATLRGYDEDRFRPRYAVRSFAEARLLLDRLSYAFVFADLAYIDQPEAPGVSSVRGVYSGYGLGVQVSTGIGLVVATYAASPESGWASGRVHIGLSFGL